MAWPTILSRIFSSAAAGLVPKATAPVGTKYLRDDGTWQTVASGGGAWGGITGTLSAQTDLQAALDAKQPSDADLTAIAALVTTAYGRGLLTLADAAAALTNIGAAAASHSHASGAITDFNEAAQDALAAAFAAGSHVGVAVAYNDVTNSFSFTATVTGQRATVRAASTANINLAAPGASIDSVALNPGNLFLGKNQTAPAENGIYVWNGAAVPATRFSDYDTYDEHPGALVTVQEGTVNADTLWLCTSNLGGTLGTTAVVWSPFNAAGALLAANNLSDLGNTATARTNLGLAIGTNVQAFDADLTALAALASAADKLPYATGAQTWALTDLSAFARTLLDDTSAATARATLDVPELLEEVTVAAAETLTASTRANRTINVAHSGSSFDLTIGTDAGGGWTADDVLDATQTSTGPFVLVGSGATLTVPSGCTANSALALGGRVVARRIGANAWRVLSPLASAGGSSNVISYALTGDLTGPLTGPYTAPLTNGTSPVATKAVGTMAPGDRIFVHARFSGAQVSTANANDVNCYITINGQEAGGVTMVEAHKSQPLFSMIECLDDTTVRVTNNFMAEMLGNSNANDWQIRTVSSLAAGVTIGFNVQRTTASPTRAVSLASALMTRHVAQ